METMTGPLSVASLLIPLAGIAVLVLFDLLATRGEGKPWWRRLLPPTAGLVGLVFLVVWCACSLVHSSYASLALAAVALVACALVARVRRRVEGLLASKVQSKVRPTLVALRDVIILVLTSVLACLALELPWNPGAITSLPTFWWIELGLVGVALFALYLIDQRRGTLPAVGVGVCMGIGLAQYYVEVFKGAAIMPSDLYSLSTAAAVGGSYSYVLQGSALAGICCAVAGMTLLAYVKPPAAQPVVRSGAKKAPKHAREGSTTSPRHPRVRAFTLAAVGLALCGGLVAAVRCVPYANLGVEVEYFFTLDKYREQGLLPSFIATAQDMPIKVPEGYSVEEAEELEATLATQVSAGYSDASRQVQFQQVQPTVIAVMNETFSDLSIYSGIADSGYQGPQFYNNGISDALLRGTLYVSAYGGGTCNTEFEFLTGTSMAYVGAGKYPYSQYDLSPIDNLARQFKNLGYSTSAIHPNKATNWSRDEVYADMGFDEFYSIDDFKDAPTFHSGVTDRATYDKILELLEEDDGPQFIFDVTMQNHSGYDQENIPADRLTHYEPEGVNQKTNDELNEYLSCIEASDADLEYFMDRLRELDRPVVLVFFGDHQPNITTPYNDAYYPDEDSVLHAERAYQTTYVMWANYDVTDEAQESQQLDTSTNYLSGLLLSSIGAPVSEYEEAQLGLRESMPAINLYGYEGADGSWYALASDGPYAGAFDVGERIAYLNFGSLVS